MFTEQQIKAAHSKVKTGADFPRYIQEVKVLGLLRYTFNVADGSTTYYGANGYELTSEPKYAQQAIAPVADAELLKQYISEHQQGKSDFITFCVQVAAIGVEQWTIDTQAMLCTYYDHAGNALVAEPIPEVR